ncbi:amidohydrolase family protein [Streptomyces sp. NPDC093109]|uniref:amidohydrolase family protein n=1 Tax=Streptomyces sp. NPDC093109 TaxID=3154977 RepID=UPI00345080FD
MTTTEPVPEEILDPTLPIIDSHHHLSDRRKPGPDVLGPPTRYLVDEYADAVGGGHNVIASVCVQSSAMYRADGPEELKPVGETEFLNGQAAMSASGLYGNCRIGAGIVSYADLTLGDRVDRVLEAHMAAAPQRFRGVRQGGMWDEDASLVGWLADLGPRFYARDDFRRGFARLAGFGMTFDAFVLAPQLLDVHDLARAFPGTEIVLNHVGQPLGSGRYAGRMHEFFGQWKADVETVATNPNVKIKMGGLGTMLSAFPSFRADPPFPSGALAEQWRPYVETAIEAFGAERCMFESNLPMDSSGPFVNVCNAFKLMTKGCSEPERRAFFAGTAASFYRLDV